MQLEGLGIGPGCWQQPWLQQDELHLDWAFCPGIQSCADPLLWMSQQLHWRDSSTTAGCLVSDLGSKKSLSWPGMRYSFNFFIYLKRVSTELFFPKVFEAWVVSVIARISSCKSCSSWSQSPWGWGRRGAVGFSCLEIGSWKGVSPFCFIFVLRHLFFQSLYPLCPVL